MVDTFLRDLFGKLWENMQNRSFSRLTIYGLIREITHVRLWPDWGLRG